MAWTICRSPTRWKRSPCAGSLIRRSPAGTCGEVWRNSKTRLVAACPFIGILKTVDLNLETLKNEILGYLESSDFAIFRSHAGGLEGLPVISWDTERCPDYWAFLDTARKA